MKSANCLVFLSVVTFLLMSSGNRLRAGEDYIAIDVSGGIGGVSGFARGIGDGQIVGDGTINGYTVDQALLYTGVGINDVNLSQSLMRASAMGVAAGQQVGWINLPTSGTPNHAVLWNSTPGSFVDLHPNTGYTDSMAYRTDGTQQVGYAYASSQQHAMLWAGTASSAIDLNPSGYQSSIAYAVSNGIQGGSAVPESVPNGTRHALIWSGTSASAVDLNPDGYSYSEIRGIGNGFQAGTASSSVSIDATIWHGTAASATSITPAGWTYSNVSDANGSYIAGYGQSAPGIGHALVWSVAGNVATATDLNAFLPTSYRQGTSTTGVDSAGNVVGAAGSSSSILWWKAGQFNFPTFTVGVNTTYRGFNTLSNYLTLDSARPLAVTTALTISNASTLNLDNGNITAANIQLQAGSTLSGSGDVHGAVNGDVSSRIVASGNLSLGDDTAYSSFITNGSLEVGNATVTLKTLGFATLGSTTSLSGGTLNAANGVSLSSGRNLVGSGTINAKIAALAGSTIAATGNLTLGNATSSVGFDSDGELYTNNNTVTLNDSNQAVLGSLTQLGSGGNAGILNATNGFLVDFGKNLVGQGTVNSVNSLAKAAIINGSAQGTGTGLTLTGYIKGVGTYSGTVTFGGTYSPGLSPASVNLENMNLAPSSTLVMEVGGLTPGSQYDVLNLSGTGTLNGTLEIDWINGFTPTRGNSFNIINGMTNGKFSNLLLPPLTKNLGWDTSALYSSGMLTVIFINSWKGPGSGSYNLASNWTDNIVPNGVDATANFLGNITTLSNVTLNTDVTLGTINFNSTKSYILKGTSNLILQTSSGESSINVQTGRQTISVPIILNSDTLISGAGILNLSGGISGEHTLTIQNTTTATSIQVDTLIVYGNLSARSIQADTLTIGASGLMAVPEPSTFGLLGMGAFGLLAWIWRRNHKAS